MLPDDSKGTAVADASWSIFDELPAMIWRSRADGTCDYFNRSWLELTGRALEQETCEGWLSGIHPDDLPSCLGIWHTARRARAAFEMEFRLRRHDGEYRWIVSLATPLRGPAGRFDGHVGNCFDVTDRHRIEERLQASEGHSRSLFENLREGVAVHELVYDSEGNPSDYRILDVNPAFCGHTGLSRDQILGKLATEAYASQLPPYFDTYAEVVATLQARSFETYFQPLDRYFKVSAFPLGHSQFATVFADVTDLNRMEEQLRHAQKMEAVGRLAGGIAHDFNNLLMIMLAHGEFALEHLAAGHPSRSNVESILTAAQRAAALTGQLLTFSRKQVVQSQVLDLNEVVGETGGMLKRILGEDIQLEIIRGRNLKHVRADAGQVAQALLNLAVNARDAMPDGGKLTIETTNVRLHAAAGLSSGQPGPHVMLAVRDTGVGMTRDVQRHLFEPFFTTKPEGKGTGLGLPMVYGIVKQSGGEIRVRSRPGHGSAFRIFLPAVEQWDSASAAKAPAAARGTETVLLAEDDAEVRRITMRLLEDLGYRPIPAESGEQALELLRDPGRAIDALISDVVMPGISGPELSTQARRIRPTLPVLFISGYPDVAATCGVALREDNLLSKPFPAELLGRKLRRLLDRR